MSIKYIKNLPKKLDIIFKLYILSKFGTLFKRMLLKEKQSSKQYL